MIHEEICTYEVCKLAKEKGFKWKCRDYYNMDSELRVNGIYALEYTNSHIDEGYMTAPTQSQLQRWLREEKGIHISVFPNMANSFAFDYIVYNKGDKFWNPVYTAHSDFDTYELALEDALKYALENLI